ncbi:hypothetical protein [Dyadobacter sp. CY323]|uniref:hypothetical protein n=1 Tax=Dyadobacter sp. CY323 TaxID=2907302 RepID=UPI001F4359B5|nr:hypothetical protein [Dyadobacter sp. CY323]MCE6988139.1 hypothetical protein [Dyadobacter sp. CY323]
MTKEQAEQLALEAGTFLKRRKISSFPHPQGLGEAIIADLHFVGTKENIINGEYFPLGVWQDGKGKYSTEDLSDLLKFFKNNPEKDQP